MWYSTAMPKGTTTKSLLVAEGLDGTILSEPFFVVSNEIAAAGAADKDYVATTTIHILATAMGMKNGGETPRDGKGIVVGSGKHIGPTFGGVPIGEQPWNSTWFMPGEHLQIYAPATTNAVQWRNVNGTSVGGSKNDIETAPIVWFRTFFDLPLDGGDNDDDSDNDNDDHRWNVEQGEQHAGSRSATMTPPPQLAYALNLTTMWKGVAYVNGFMLGRYWLEAGSCQGSCAPPIKNGHCYMHWSECGQPTQTLYHVPTSVLKSTGNLVVLFEESGVPPNGAPMQKKRHLNGVSLIALRDHPVFL